MLRTEKREQCINCGNVDTLAHEAEEREQPGIACHWRRLFLLLHLKLLGKSVPRFDKPAYPTISSLMKIFSIPVVPDIAGNDYT